MARRGQTGAAEKESAAPEMTLRVQASQAFNV